MSAWLVWKDKVLIGLHADETSSGEVIARSSRPRGLAIFDLDDTLLEGDSELLWAHTLYEEGLVNSDFVDRIELYYADYERGELDIHAYEEFLLRPFTQYPVSRLHSLRGLYLTRIADVVRPALMWRAAWHQAQGHALLIVTAANSFIAEPIAAWLGFQNVICTVIEREGDRYTGRITGTPAFQAGKVQLLQQWLMTHRIDLSQSWGYSDSHNDLPILNLVAHPVAVTPDAQLLTHASEHQWEIIASSE